MPRSLLTLSLVALLSTPCFAQGFGTLKGKFLFDGKIPALKPLVEKGGKGQNGALVKNADICGAEAVPDDSLVVDPETKGIANVFIYLKSAPDTIDPKQAAVPAKPVIFDQKGCSFEPHALFVRAGQPVEVRSQDNCAHNTHTFPLKNEALNFLLPPKPDPFPIPGDQHPQSEILPIQVKCDIHPWMMAYWLILDHPYAAISGPDGTFEIKGLPEGEHSFRVWHERAGYLDRGLDVTITANGVATVEETYPDKDFEE